jgi:hypothetical protein
MHEAPFTAAADKLPPAGARSRRLSRRHQLPHPASSNHTAASEWPQRHCCHGSEQSGAGRLVSPEAGGGMWAWLVEGARDAGLAHCVLQHS